MIRWYIAFDVVGLMAALTGAALAVSAHNYIAAAWAWNCGLWTLQVLMKDLIKLRAEA